jgi:hypothetical protein
MTLRNSQLTIEPVTIADKSSGGAPLREKLEKRCDDPAQRIESKNRQRKNESCFAAYLVGKSSYRQTNNALFTIESLSSAG